MYNKLNINTSNTHILKKNKDCSVGNGNHAYKVTWISLFLNFNSFPIAKLTKNIKYFYCYIFTYVHAFSFITLLEQTVAIPERQ